MNQPDQEALETKDSSDRSWLNGWIQCKYPDPNSSTAELVGYYENGRLWFSYPIVNCLKQGVCRIWDENGQLQIEEVFEKDRLHGLRREWYPNGNIKADTRYRNGQTNGAYKT